MNNKKNNREEIMKIKRAMLDAIPYGVDKLNIIIALSQMQEDFAEILQENGSEEAMENDK